MTITKFTQLIAQKEGKKIQVSIAQIAEILKIINKLLGGALYSLIRGV